MSEIKLNSSAQATLTVDSTNTAKAVGSGSLEVLATPMMIALMEKAATKALAPFLENSQTSVGTEISTTHDLASPIGATVTATATVVAVDRRRIDFEVSASSNDKVIGHGTHSRFIVDSEKFMNKLK